MTRWIAAWQSLPLAWKLAFVLALVWLPVGALIILSTSAVGEPLPMPWRLLRLLVTYTAYGVIIATIVKVARRR